MACPIELFLCIVHNVKRNWTEFRIPTTHSYSHQSKPITPLPISFNLNMVSPSLCSEDYQVSLVLSEPSGDMETYSAQHCAFGRPFNPLHKVNFSSKKSAIHEDIGWDLEGSLEFPPSWVFPMFRTGFVPPWTSN